MIVGMMLCVTDNTPAITAAAAVSARVTDVKNGTNSDTASQQHVHKSPLSCERGQQTSDKRDSYKHSQATRPASHQLTGDVSAHRPSSASSSFSNFFQASDLELTDADLEFSPR